MDLYESKIKGWSLSDQINTDETLLRAWNMAEQPIHRGRFDFLL